MRGKYTTNTFLGRHGYNRPTNNKQIGIQNENEFPSLKSQNKKSCDTEEESKTPVYSKIVKTEMVTFEKKEKATVPDGYVVAKFDKNRIIIEMDSKLEMDKRMRDELNRERLVKKTHFEMISRWQKERDELNDLLGTQSPYWDSINLFEFDEDELNGELFDYEDIDEEEEDEFETEDFTYNEELY